MSSDFGKNLQICVCCSHLVKIIILLKNTVGNIDCLLGSTLVSSDFGKNLQICVCCSHLVKIIISLKNTVGYIDFLLEPSDLSTLGEKMFKMIKICAKERPVLFTFN